MEYPEEAAIFFGGKSDEDGTFKNFYLLNLSAQPSIQFGMGDMISSLAIVSIEYLIMLDPEKAGSNFTVTLSKISK